MSEALFAISEAQEGKNADADERIARLVRELAEKQLARRGRVVNPWWAWCATCGAVKVYVAAADAGKSKGSSSCDACKEAAKRAAASLRYRKGFLVCNPQQAISEEEIALLAEARAEALPAKVVAVIGGRSEADVVSKDGVRFLRGIIGGKPAVGTEIRVFIHSDDAAVAYLVAEN